MIQIFSRVLKSSFIMTLFFFTVIFKVLFAIATLAIEKSGQGLPSCQSKSEQQLKDLNANPTTSVSGSPAGVPPPLPDEIRKFMPIYLEKFLADYSKNLNSRSPQTT